MADQISYSTVMNVCTCWDRLKRVPNYRDKCGQLILQRAFQLDEEIMAVFKFDPKEDYRSNPTFVQHARAMVDMTDCAVSLLGPDLDPLAEDLHDLGKRHVEMYGVQIEFLPVMEKAIMYAIEELVGDKLTKDDRNSWSTVFHYLITHMRKGMKMANGNNK